MGLKFLSDVWVDCQGIWATCDSECVSTYVISVQAEHGGVECAYESEETVGCRHGEGDCQIPSKPSQT